ncbi:amidohydrolase [Hoeflea sp.]|uniref:amidohydrolase n=1 Tax=Hoeflea sp. TaxID=1940281 RepID=UPI0025BA6A2D|nr:amidohydrolase [Hoeflea sp.]
MAIADLIITNGAVLTMDPDLPRAEAVAVKDGRIIAVGCVDEVARLAGPGTQVIDAGGATVLPGFIESHMHLFIGGAELQNLQLDGCADLDSLARELTAFAATRPDTPLLVGQGPDYGIFGAAAPRLVLDKILPGRPVALMAHDHHTVWANTAALEAAGVLHGLETSDGHEVVMGADGLATGTLLEPEAYSPVMRLGGQERTMLGLASGREPDLAPSAAERAVDLAHLKRGLAHAARHGITSIVNMDGNVYTLDLLEEIRAAGELTARVRVPFHYVPDMRPDDLETALEMRARWSDEWLASGFVKFFMDGVIDSRTAFMKHDYPGQPGYRSHGRFSAETFAELATRIDAMGLQIAVHAIGDAAVARVLDGYATARAANGASGLRHRIEHLELVDDADFARIAELEVIASIQPPHAPGCSGLPLEPTLSNIGRDRWGDAFAWQKIAATGAAIALASDWPVSDISILKGIHSAVTRAAWAPDVPDHRFSLEAALRGYTIGGAYAERSDSYKGSLEIGKVADLVVLDRDIMAIQNDDEIGDISVRITICGGHIVYNICT